MRTEARPGDVAQGRATSTLSVGHAADVREDAGGDKRASRSLVKPEPSSDFGTRTQAAASHRMQYRDKDGQVAALTRNGEGESSGSKAAARAESKQRLEGVGAPAAGSARPPGLDNEQTGPAGSIVSPPRSGRFVSKGGVCHAVESPVSTGEHRDENDLSGNFTVTFMPDTSVDRRAVAIAGMDGVQSESNRDVMRYPGSATQEINSQNVAVVSDSASNEKRPQVGIHPSYSSRAFTSKAAAAVTVSDLF